ncbi:hypothetical protein D8B26_004780 [Coccidioides posadasii str. Silveira]|uniref:uncharacterized protein n=1 Tax=Coccidioides posadasii (strain RMSCC 757 / Silveira) TaxID=443226 RepID=UPI001BEDFB7C|nr:hypothetical protein D8B26_004780 [Coccidioides posadasii str. Silveira]
MVDHNESALARAASNNLAAVAESPAPETAPRDASKVADGVPSPPAHDHHHHHHSSSSSGSEACDPDGTSNANSAHDGSPEVDISDFSSDASSTQSLDDYPGLTLGAEYGSSNDLLSFPEQDGQPFGELVEDLSHFYYAPTMDFVSDFADGLSSTASNNSYLDPDDQDMNIHDPFSFATAAPSDPTTPSYVAPPDFGDGLQYDDMALDNDDDHDDHGDNDGYAFADQGFGDEVSDGLHSAHLRFIRDDGSLIERSDLFGFAHDRLPSAMFFGAVNDPNDSCDDRDTDKFYASDDEVSMGDAAMDSEPPGRGRSTDTRIHHDGAIAEDHRVDHEASAHPVPLGTPHLPSFDAVYAQHNDGEVDGDFNNQGGLSMHTETFERNLTVDQFIRQWFVRSCVPRYHLRAFKEPFVPISPEAANVLDWERPAKISRPDSSRLYDIQGIPWSTTLKVKRSDARALRDRLYTSYHNLKYTPHGYHRLLPEKEDYFRPKTMYTKYRASMAHFQLRNLMSVTASNTIQYASHSKVYSITPFYGEQNCLMNLAGPVPSATFFDSVKISTMRAKHGVTVVGGFSGEYAVRGEINDFAVMDGRVTRDPNGITNHIDIIKHRTSNSPRTVISSNDDRIRILDCETNRFVSMHKFARAINCTDTSPDGRLRVIIGDAPDAWIIDSETGKPVQTLIGHRDYGFACAWSPDMLHIATSNQDKTVNIWDARMWRTLQVIDSDVAGYRSLRFSPVGGGPRTLLMCEPADRIAIVNAQTYQTRQVHDFFGEIGGADYSPDGSRIWVANMDTKFGGFMEFDRREWGQEFGIGHTRRRRIEAQGDFYSPDLPNEWLPEARLDDDPRCVLGSGERKIRFQKLFNDTQYEMLDPLLG